MLKKFINNIFNDHNKEYAIGTLLISLSFGFPFIIICILSININALIGMVTLICAQWCWLTGINMVIRELESENMNLRKKIKELEDK